MYSSLVAAQALVWWDFHFKFTYFIVHIHASSHVFITAFEHNYDQCHMMKFIFLLSLLYFEPKRRENNDYLIKLIYVAAINFIFCTRIFLGWMYISDMRADVYMMEYSCTGYIGICVINEWYMKFRR